MKELDLRKATYFADVPDSWKVVPLLHIVRYSTGFTPPSGNESYYGDDYPWVNISDLNGERVIYETQRGLSSHAVESFPDKLPAPEGSLLFSFKLSLGNVAIAGRDLYTNEAIAAFIPNKELSIDYAYYCFPVFLPLYSQTNIYGAELLGGSRFEKSKIPIPPLEKQQRIADYLDRETAEIDAAVEDLDRYMELLKERRKVVISDFVTKGIAPHRDSCPPRGEGVELSPRDKQRLYPWLAYSSPNWTETRFDSFLQMKRRVVGDNWSTTPLLSLTLRGVVLRDIASNEGKIPASYADYQTVNAGDLVMCLFDIDETPRTVGLSPLTGMITSAYSVFEIDEEVADPQYLEFFLTHIDDRKMFRPIYSGLRKVVRKDAFGQALIKLPPLEVQRQIASHLIQETAELDSLIDESIKLRDLLLKRRSVLITEVVTGRKQV